MPVQGGVDGSLQLTISSMNRLNETEPATFSILTCWAFFRDSYFLYFVGCKWYCFSFCPEANISQPDNSVLLGQSRINRDRVTPRREDIFITLTHLCNRLTQTTATARRLWDLVSYDMLNKIEHQLVRVNLIKDTF
jgi:hypothetical protein